MEKEKDFYVDFTTVKWVAWDERKPDWNGSVLFRYNGSNTGHGIVIDGEIKDIGGFKDQHTINYLSKSEGMPLYWQEETHDWQGWEKYQQEISAKFLKEKNKKKWEKLDKQFYDVIDNMTDEDWHDWEKNREKYSEERAEEMREKMRLHLEKLNKEKNG